ncbi:MAG: M24 family metallopeptidase [Omnitrophica WOR_2 bacterium]
MKKDLDALMETRNIQALLVTGPAQHNPAMVYFTGGAHLTGADLIKKRGAEPVLFYNPMERDEAALSGLQTTNLADFRFDDIRQQAGGDYQKALAMRYRQMLIQCGVTSGRVVLYGRMDAGAAYALFSTLQGLAPELEIAGDVYDPLMLDAMETKDSAEVDRIRHMGQVTTEVVGSVADFLTSHTVRSDVLVKRDGELLTIGDVKSKINLWLAERGVENPEGTIFTIGRDAAVPHSVGNPLDVIRQGQTIVFDIYPCEAGGGYFYDFTRTWCLGYATDEVIRLYEDVRDVFERIKSEMKVNAFWPDYHKLACDLFQGKGYPTIESDPQTHEGYVHGIGHGVGLHIHERPYHGKNATDRDRLFPGVVVTVEPGLYYPDRGMGVRLEDTVWVRPDGRMETLAEYPYDLILPMKS